MVWGVELRRGRKGKVKMSCREVGTTFVMRKSEKGAYKAN